MKARNTNRNYRPESGIALLISIFILLLISVVAIALIVSSGTESSLAGNYRSATSVYYAALAGLEEGRGRLMAKNPKSFMNTAPGFLPPPSTPLAVGSPVYIINPAGSEIVAPWDPSSTYPDSEFNPEFSSSGFTLPNPSPSTPSATSSTVAGIQGPFYKWVRINAVSERSLNLDVYPYDGTYSSTTPVFYDGTRLNVSSSGAQVLEITSLAVLPNGSQKLLQYLVAQTKLDLSLPSALTLVGEDAHFDGPNWNQYFVNGIDQYAPPGSSCVPGSPVAAIGYTDSSSYSNIVSGSGISTYPNNYFNGAPPTPSVKPVTLPANLQTPAGLDALVQTIKENADLIINKTPPDTAKASDLPPGITDDTRTMTIVVEGDFKLVDWAGTGYGLLLVTGDLTYDAAASWRGLILVIGKGKFVASKDGAGEFDGAVLVAQTRDLSGTLFTDPDMMTASFNQTTKGHGIYYSSCWVQAAMPASIYKILSFHEISQ